MSAELSQRDIAAMVIVTLTRHGVIKRTPQHFGLALKALGLTYGDLTRAEQLATEDWKPDGAAAPTAAALAKYAEGVGRNPTKQQRRARDEGRVCANDLCIDEVPGRRTSSPFCSDACRDDQMARDARMARTGRSGVTKWCTGCEGFHDVEEFRVTRNGKRRDGTAQFKLKSMCLVAEQNYQRRRYVSTKVEEDLNALGIVLKVDDEMVGLACSCCDRPFKVGQRVVGEARLEHWSCKYPEEPAVPIPQESTELDDGHATAGGTP